MEALLRGMKDEITPVYSSSTGDDDLHSSASTELGPTRDFRVALNDVDDDVRVNLNDVDVEGGMLPVRNGSGVHVGTASSSCASSDDGSGSEPAKNGNGRRGGLLKTASCRIKKSIRRNVSFDGMSKVAANEKDKDNASDDGKTKDSDDAITRASALSRNAKVLADVFSKIETAAHEQIFKGQYDKKECMYAFACGSLGSFNYGFISGACVSGLVSTTGTSMSVSGLSGSFTGTALNLASGDMNKVLYYLLLLIFYTGGSLLSGIVCPHAVPYQIDPKYGPLFLVGAGFLLMSSIIAAYDIMPIAYSFYFAAAANGLQNGIASLYSANLIRCSLTGTSVDISLLVGKWMRGNTNGMEKMVVFLMISINFWLGGLIAFYATAKFTSATLLFSAGLFALIGFSLVYFLVKELGVSVKHALSGNFEEQLAHGRRISMNRITDEQRRELGKQRLMAMFDEIDDDGNGYIDAHELHMHLIKTDPTITFEEVRIIIQAVDVDGDEQVDREEWIKLVAKMAEPTFLSSRSHRSICSSQDISLHSDDMSDLEGGVAKRYGANGEKTERTDGMVDCDVWVNPVVTQMDQPEQQMDRRKQHTVSFTEVFKDEEECVNRRDTKIDPPKPITDVDDDEMVDFEKDWVNPAVTNMEQKKRSLRQIIDNEMSDLEAEWFNLFNTRMQQKHGPQRKHGGGNHDSLSNTRMQEKHGLQRKHGGGNHDSDDDGWV